MTGFSFEGIAHKAIALQLTQSVLVENHFGQAIAHSKNALGENDG